MKELLFGVILFWAGACTLMGQETGSNKAGKNRLFILSGQSNMVYFDPAPTFEPALQKAFPGNQIIVVKDAHVGQPIMKWYKNFKPPKSWLPSKKKPTDGDAVDLKGPRGMLYDVLLEKVKTANSAEMIGRVFDAEVLVSLKPLLSFKSRLWILLEQFRRAAGRSGPGIGLLADRDVQLVIHENSGEMEFEG